MTRLKVFAKGNLDVRDTLHSLRVGGKLHWNGINEVARVRHPSTVVQLIHETWTRSDALLESTGTVPPDLAQHTLPAGPYSAASQFSRAVFDTDADAIVLSIQPDVASTLVRHKHDGYLFHPGQWRDWSEADRAWLSEQFAFVDLLDVGASMRNLERIIHAIRERSRAPILVYNLSSVVPGDTVHCHQGLGDTLATRIRRFNLAVTELSQRTGISVVDVDAIVSRAGATRLKLDAFHLNGEACRHVAEETVRVLEDLGCFAGAA
ncbi:MAG TPA: SGNH/GDSL hydrolase family protein [Casimicrobiaceae bacterium]|nr:SGNH/GDSL hydrolase family protein [Casimicrobiaceae bacterium]